MRSTVIAASLALVLCAAPALAQQVEPEIFTLPNGMKFLLVPRSDQPNAIAVIDDKRHAVEDDNVAEMFR